MQNLETEVATLESELKTAEEELALPEVYGDRDKLSAANSRYEELKYSLNQKHSQWEELAEKIMELES